LPGMMNFASAPAMRPSRIQDKKPMVVCWLVVDEAPASPAKLAATSREGKLKYVQANPCRFRFPCRGLRVRDALWTPASRNDSTISSAARDCGGPVSAKPS
jgi:hypothetical protein